MNPRIVRRWESFEAKREGEGEREREGKGRRKRKTRCAIVAQRIVH